MISPQAKQRAINLVESGVKEGATLLLDGRDVVVPGYENGNFFGPTVLHHVKVSQVSMTVITYFYVMHLQLQVWLYRNLTMWPSRNILITIDVILWI